jgi:predicted MFS family arabinose efflux permease
MTTTSTRAETPHSAAPDPTPISSGQAQLSTANAILMFAAFAVAYFISAALRTVTATIAPLLTTEFALQARDLGLLSGGYFLGFAILQIPLGGWLDRYGPKRVILVMLSIAVLGCLVFMKATSFEALLAARFFTGLGVSVCLMAPLTAYRRWFKPETQLRANSWMLMTGSLGMLSATLPVQAMLPDMGWRGVFGVMALVIACAMLLIAALVPQWRMQLRAQEGVQAGAQSVDTRLEPTGGLQRMIWTHPYFKRMVPLGFFTYGGMVALQTLWAGPWMTRVAGYSPTEAAGGLFAINLAMLINYSVWGWLNPRLARRGWDAVWLMKRGLPVGLLALPMVAWLATDGIVPIWVVWIVYFIATSFVSLAQPAVGMAFPSHMAGRALTAYNLVIFMGVFCMQWGFGLAVDAGLWLGLGVTAAFQAALLVYWLLCVGAYWYFYRAKS